MTAAKAWNASLLLRSFNSTPGAEVPRTSQSLCPGKRNLCWLESLGEEREEMVPLAQGNTAAWRWGSSCHKRLCVQ